jgi:hypothetical protein
VCLSEKYKVSELSNPDETTILFIFCCKYLKFEKYMDLNMKTNELSIFGFYNSLKVEFCLFFRVVNYKYMYM